MTYSTTKMNNFLQRMLRKNNDEIDDESVVCDSVRQQVRYSPQRNKSNWMRKLGSYSPSKLGSSTSVTSPSRPITSRPSGNRHDCRPKSAHEPLITSENSRGNVEMPNLEKIIHEFEEGFLSPTKYETQETMKSGRFVKQIVAAFEEKYKAYNEHKMEADEIIYETNEDDQTLRNDNTTVNNSLEDSTSFMGRTYVINSLDNHMCNYNDISESSSSIPHSPQSFESIDLGMCSFAMDEDLAVSTPEKKILHDSTVRRSLNSNANITNDTMDSVSRTTIESTPLLRSNSSIRRDRQPKIVGAFLKNPIEVEDTSIDWIPIIGKKLPRKKSFKRLLAMLTGKKSSAKSSKLYGSQVNIQEDCSRELHDSGYDEKSCSSSSLASLVSFTDLLLEPEKYEIVTDRRTVTTFRQTNDNVQSHNKHENPTMTKTEKTRLIDGKSCCDLDNDDNDATPDDASDTQSVASNKKLLLEEMPRSDVRLSLGPYFPSRSAIKTNNRDSQVESTWSQDFSDYSFDDITEETSISERNYFQPMNNLIIDYPDDVKLRRNVQSWKFPDSEVTYDVPRNYMSRSEPGLVTIGRQQRHNVNDSTVDEIVYDVPKPEIPQRPRSSVYDDALSLKRRNNNFALSPPVSGFYAFPSQEQPHYATVKPRNTRICPSRELMRSVGEIGQFGNVDRRNFAGIGHF